MPIRKLPTTFDQHLGSVIDGLAKSRGGRTWLATLTTWSEGTVERRMTGRTEITVKELEIVASALSTTAASIVSQALRNYANGSEQDGIDKLLREAAPAVSEPPTSLAEHRFKTKSPAHMTDDELEGERSAANTDPEIGFDQPEDV